MYLDPSGHVAGSIIDYLNTHHKDSSYSARKDLAKELNIKNYTGTAAQNTQMLNTLKKQETVEKAVAKKTVAQAAAKKEAEKAEMERAAKEKTSKNVIPKNDDISKKVYNTGLGSLDISASNYGTSIQVGTKLVSVLSSTGYRYVSESEYQFIMKNGYIPNVTANNQLKDVYVSTNNYDTVASAEKALQIGSQNPYGPGPSPKYRIEFKIDSVQYDYMGRVEGGTGIELTTRDKIYVDKDDITKLKINNDSDNNNSGGSGKSDTDIIVENELGDRWRIDAKGIYHPGNFDNNNVWHDNESQLYDGYQSDTFIMPNDPIMPNFTPKVQPSFKFAW
jgi:hypothetical protein